MKRWKVWEAFRNPNVIRRNSNEPKGILMAILVVCTYEVDGQENVNPMKRSDTVMDVWQGISVRDGVLIQGTVVTTRPPVAGF